MEIVEWKKGYNSNFKKTVLTIGNFDGVHLGHQAIFKDVVKKAKETGGTPAILTFDPHPQTFFSGKDIPLITGFEKKMELIWPFGIEVAFVCGRSKEFYMMSADEFVRDVLVDSLHISHIFVGDDFAFGSGREGNFDLLRKMGKKYGFNITEERSVKLGGVLIKSTVIRNIITSGRMAEASIYLGRYFSIKGKVISGVGRGKKLGIPTANLEYKGGLIPPFGVYVVNVLLDGKVFGGVANIGDNPTFGDVTFSFEVHILDFDRDLYGKEIEVSFIARIRGEEKFDSIKELKKRIRKDIKTAKNILKWQAR